MFTRLPDPERVKRVLVVKLSSMGDILHVTPCLRALREALPQAEIAIAVDRRFSETVRHNPNVDTVIESKQCREHLFRRYSRIRRELKPQGGAKAARPAPFDLAIDFQDTRRSVLWTYASRARVKAGRGGFRPGWALAIRPDPAAHAVRVCAAILEAIGVPVPNLEPQLFCSPKDDDDLGRLLLEHGLPPNGFIALNPFNHWASKTWPVERYADLARRLHGDFKIPIVLTGSPREAAAVPSLTSLVEPGMLTSLVGKLTLGQAFCLYRRARLMVTGDSGPMHAMAALGGKVVALFGPTLPERTGPWGSGHAVIQSLRPPEHHAYRSDPERKYMSAIDIGAVYSATAGMLEAPV